MSEYSESEYGTESVDVDQEIERMNLKFSNLDQVTGKTAAPGVNRSRQEKDATEEEDLMMFLKKIRRENEGLKANLQDLVSSKKSEGGEMQLRKLENEVHRQRQAYDSIQHEIRTQLRRIQKKEEELSLLRRTYLKRRVKKKKKKAEKGLEDKHKQIRMLENRLDKTIIKLNESQMIRETYVKILKRLKRERMGFDNQLRSIEKTLKSKSNDYEDLRQTYHEANYLKELSKTHLKEARASLGQLRKMKQKELEEKKKDVISRIKNTESMNRRGQKRKEFDLENQGYISKKDQEHLQKASVLQQFGDMQSDQTLKKKQDSLNHLESIWRKIKEVTGVSTTREVIEKFHSSKDTFKNLQKVTRHSQNKIDLLQRKRNNYKEKLESLKFTQSTMTGMGTKRMVDEFIQQLNDSKALLEKNRKDYERMQNILIRVKSGLSHLLEKLNQIFDNRASSSSKKKRKTKTDDDDDDEDDDYDFPMTDQDFILDLIEKCKVILEQHFKDLIETPPTKTKTIPKEEPSTATTEPEKEEDKIIEKDGEEVEEPETKPVEEEDGEKTVTEEPEEETTTKTTTTKAVVVEQDHHAFADEDEGSEVFKESDEELYQVTKYNTRLKNLPSMIINPISSIRSLGGVVVGDPDELMMMTIEERRERDEDMSLNIDDLGIGEDGGLSNTQNRLLSDEEDLSESDESDGMGGVNADDEVDVLNRQQVKKLAALALLKHKSKIAKRT